MVTSKQLLDQTGLSRATLNNYIGLGLLPRPIVKRLAPEPGARLATLGYFPDWTLQRIQLIQSFKKQGLSMDQIVELVLSEQTDHGVVQGSQDESAQPSLSNRQPICAEKDATMSINNNSEKMPSEILNVSIDSIPHPGFAPLNRTV